MCKIIKFDNQIYLEQLHEQYSQLSELKKSYQSIIDDFEKEKNKKLGHLLVQLNALNSNQNIENNLVQVEKVNALDMKKLFKDLAKKLHPDKSQDEEIKSLNIKLFQVLNDAKQTNNLELMIQIKTHLDLGFFHQSSLLENQTLENKILKLELQITNLKIEIDTIEKSSYFKHIQALNCSYDNYFEQLSKELSFKINYLKKKELK